MTTNSWMEIDITCGTKIHALRAGTPLLFVTWLFKIIFEVNYHVYVKCQTRICTTWPSFPFTCRLLFIISSHRLVVLRNFLSIRIVLSCFYLLIFYFEKFSTGIWRLPFAVYVKPLKISYRYVAGFFFPTARSLGRQHCKVHDVRGWQCTITRECWPLARFILINLYMKKFFSSWAI